MSDFDGKTAVQSIPTSNEVSSRTSSRSLNEDAQMALNKDVERISDGISIIKDMQSAESGATKSLSSHKTRKSDCSTTDDDQNLMEKTDEPGMSNKHRKRRLAFRKRKPKRSERVDNESTDDTINCLSGSDNEQFSARSFATPRSLTDAGSRSPVKRTLSTPKLNDKHSLGDRHSATYRSHPHLTLTKSTKKPKDERLPAIQSNGVNQVDLPATDSRLAEHPERSFYDSQLPPLYDTSSTTSSFIDNIGQQAVVNSSRKQDLVKKYGEMAAIAEEEVNSNWVLADQQASRHKLRAAQDARFLVSCADRSDPLTVLEMRKEELTLMAKPRREPGYCLDKLTPETREMVLRIKDSPIEKERKLARESWSVSTVNTLIVSFEVFKFTCVYVDIICTDFASMLLS